jgi:large subunit ribosomal protein L19
MSSVIDSIERRQRRQGLPSFTPGDRVRVHFQVVEGSRRRTQVFEGIVLRRQGSGVRETFTVRKQSFGVGVERTFPLHSPKIERLEIAARGDVRRAKLYYLRGRIGKKARVAERRWGIDEELVSAPQPPQDASAVAAGPVAEDGSPSSRDDAAGGEPSSTPPAEEAAKSDEAPAAEAEAPVEEEGAGGPEGGETEETAAAQDAGDEEPGGESGDSGEGSA